MHLSDLTKVNALNNQHDKLAECAAHLAKSNQPLVTISYVSSMGAAGARYIDVDRARLIALLIHEVDELTRRLTALGVDITH